MEVLALDPDGFTDFSGCGMGHFKPVRDFSYWLPEIHIDMLNSGLHWDAHDQRKTAPGTPHAGMSDIWLRANDIKPFIERGSMAGFCDPHVPVWYEAGKAMPRCRDAVEDIMQTVRGEMLGGVLITKMAPGARIEPHIDRGWHPEYFDKFYLPITSAPGCNFSCRVGDTVETLCPRPGHVWQFDNSKEHWVENHSDIDRIMMIVCVRTNRYRDRGKW